MPRIFLGDTSDKYSGTTKLTIPTARPTIILDNTSIAILGATALKIEPIINIIAVAIIIFYVRKYQPLLRLQQHQLLRLSVRN